MVNQAILCSSPVYMRASSYEIDSDFVQQRYGMLMTGGEFSTPVPLCSARLRRCESGVREKEAAEGELVAWGHFEKSLESRTNASFHFFCKSQGTGWGTTSFSLLLQRKVGSNHRQQVVKTSD
jgi:hypothetical protein